MVKASRRNACPADTIVPIAADSLPEPPADDDMEEEDDLNEMEESNENADESSEIPTEDANAEEEDDEQEEIRTLSLRPVELKSTTKPGRKKDRMKISKAIRLNALFTPQENPRKIDDFDMWVSTNFATIRAAVEEETGNTSESPAVPSGSSAGVGDGGGNDDEEEGQSLDLSSLISGLLQNASADDANEIEEDPDATEEEPQTEEDTVLISSYRMKKYKMKADVIKKPPRETGLIEIRDGTLQKKREAKKEQQKLFAERITVGVDFFREQGGPGKLNVEPIEPHPSMRAYHQHYNEEGGGSSTDSNVDGDEGDDADDRAMNEAFGS